MRGGGEWQIQHEAKLSACCICHETPPRVLYFLVQHEYTVLLLICWFCVGGLLVFSVVRNSQYKSFRQGRIFMMHAFKVYSKYLTQSLQLVRWFNGLLLNSTRRDCVIAQFGVMLYCKNCWRRELSSPKQCFY